MIVKRQDHVSFMQSFVNHNQLRDNQKCSYMFCSF